MRWVVDYGVLSDEQGIAHTVAVFSSGPSDELINWGGWSGATKVLTPQLQLRRAPNRSWRRCRADPLKDEGGWPNEKTVFLAMMMCPFAVLCRLHSSSGYASQGCPRRSVTTRVKLPSSVSKLAHGNGTCRSGIFFLGVEAFRPAEPQSRTITGANRGALPNFWGIHRLRRAETMPWSCLGYSLARQSRFSRASS